MLSSFNQELKTLDGDLSIWDKMPKIDLDVLITYDIIPSIEMFYEYQGLMGHKARVIERLVTEVKEALKSCNIVVSDVMNDLKHMGCKVLTMDDSLMTEEDMTSTLTDRLHVEFELDGFGVQVLNLQVLS